MAKKMKGRMEPHFPMLQTAGEHHMSLDTDGDGGAFFLGWYKIKKEKKRIR